MIFLRNGTPYMEIKTDVKACTKNVIAEGRHEFYSWKNDHNDLYKSGPAIIFSQGKNHLTEQFSDVLKFLEFKPLHLKLTQMKTTFSKIFALFFHKTLIYFDVDSLDGLMDNVGCLFTVVFGKIKEYRVENNCSIACLAVDVGDREFVPIGDLTRNFITTECPTFAGKPKICIFLDTDTATDNYCPMASESLSN